MRDRGLFITRFTVKKSAFGQTVFFGKNSVTAMTACSKNVRSMTQLSSPHSKQVRYTF